MSNKRALVLSGGSIKGAFQVGAFKALIESGYRPDSIYGISVGSLNALFIAQEAGKQNVSVENIDWKSIVENLIYFWINNIRQPNDIIKLKKSTQIAFEALTNNFKGLIDTSPLHNLIRRTISMEYIYKCPIKLEIGVVNIADGEIIYANPNYPNFIDYVLASCAIPIVMPIVNIGNSPDKAFLDGSMRNVAPLKRAYDKGAEEIVCIACQAENLCGVTFNYGNLMYLADRVLDILLNENVNMDIERILTINSLLSDNNDVSKRKKKAKITIIRPPVPINIDMFKFTYEDINNLIQTGYHIGKEIIMKNSE